MNLSWQHDMKAFPNSTVHYRNIIRTISTVRTTLAYVTSATYSRGYRLKQGYEQRLPYPTPNHVLPIYSTSVDILAASQVGHCLRNSARFASPMGRPISLSWLRILTFLPSCLDVEEHDNTNKYLRLIMLERKF
jgi:hypothetical protein